MSQPSIRAVQLNDKQAWLELWDQYYSLHNRNIAPEITETTFSRFIDPGIRIYCSVATVSTEDEQHSVVGFVTFYPHLTTSSIDEKVYMQDLFVSPDVQARGIGKQLVEHVYEKACEMKASSVHWTAAQTNKRAQALYARVGESTDQVVWKKTL